MEDIVYIVEEGDRWEGSHIVKVTKFRHEAMIAYRGVKMDRCTIATMSAYNTRTGNYLKSKSLITRGWD